MCEMSRGNPNPPKVDFKDDEKQFGADVLQVVIKEEVLPKQHNWCLSLDHEDPDLPHIKQEPEDLWTSRVGEQLEGPEEADIVRILFTGVPVKSEDNEEKPHLSQLHQDSTRESAEVEPLASSSTDHMKIEVDGNYCGVLKPDTKSEPNTDGNLSDSSEPETEDSNDWETWESQSILNSLKNDDVPADEGGDKPFHCSQCGKRFLHKGNLNSHKRSHTGEKPFSCSVCGKRFVHKGNLNSHIRGHTGEKPFPCSECKKTFGQKGNLKKHMRIHTGEKPLSCPVCEKRFIQRVTLKYHMSSHTGEKPFSCSVCKKGFRSGSDVAKHVRIHTGERPYSCSVCNKCFTQKTHLAVHMTIHTGEKRFNCNICGKGFIQKSHLKKHKCCEGAEPEDSI